MVNVLFVCMGNICRSPTAEGVFRRLVRDAGHAAAIGIDSAGMEGWHEGKAPDRRSQDVARLRGIEIGDLRARRVIADDFGRFDYILAMDHDNMRGLQAMCPPGRRERLHMMLDFADFPVGPAVREVPDPYFGATGFDDVLDLIENAANGLLAHIAARDL